MSRKIYIHGDIDHENFSKFSRRLSRLESESEEPIQIELISDGGDAYIALAFYDRIRESTCKISVVAYGLVASAAVVILAACNKRYMAPSAWLMVHEDDGTLHLKEGADVSTAERGIKHSRRLEDQWCKLLASVTLTSESLWSSLHKNETYLSAQECKELGIVDEIL